MAAAGVTPPASLDAQLPGFSKALLGARLEEKYLCSACKNVLRRPFQAQCGHRYCSRCLAGILRCVCPWRFPTPCSPSVCPAEPLQSCSCFP